MKTNCFKAIFLLGLTLYFSANAIGQWTENTEKCRVLYPGKTDPFETWLQARSEKSLRSDLAQTVYQIPVVVHVIHWGNPIGEGYNITDEQIYSQIRILNEDFRRKPNSPGYNEHPDGADAGIEFVLAKSDPNGQATSGIVRVNSKNIESPGFGGTMIGLGAYYSFWDPYKYLNIWSFPGVQDFGLGEAWFPIADLPGLEDEVEFVIPGLDSIHGIAVKDIDGIAINALHFGEIDLDTEYNLGRTGTHEVGHFLGLYHLWGTEGFEANCDIDDYCTDTPNISSITTGCPVNKLACDRTPAMIENYMDYTNDDCQNLFTNEQVLRMRTVLENSPRRKSLFNSDGLKYPDEILKSPKPHSELFTANPNPFHDKIQLKIPTTAISKPLKLTYYDLSGTLLKEEYIPNATSNRILLTPPSSESKLFFLKIENGSGITQLVKLVRR